MVLQNKKTFMDLKAAFLAEHSKDQTGKIITWIGDDPSRTALLMQVFLQDEYRVVQRAAWVLSGLAQLHPSLMLPYLPLLASRLGDKSAHIAVRRNIFRLFQYVPLPEPVHAPLMQHAFEALADQKEALAVRAFAMSVLARLALLYPEINNELRLLLEDALAQPQAPSFKSRAVKVLHQINRAAAT